MEEQNIFRKLGVKVRGLQSSISDEGDRTKRTKKNLFVSGLIKPVNLLLSFAFYPIALSYLDKEKFGIFATLISVLFWFSYFDIGISQGLRNKLAEAIAKKDILRARHYISTGYYYYGLITIVLIAILLTLNAFIDWPALLNVPRGLESELKILSSIVIISLVLKFFFEVINKIYLAFQLSSVIDIMEFVEKSSIITGILVLSSFTHNSLLYYGALNAVFFFLTPVLSSFLFYRGRNRVYFPSFSFVRKELAHDLTALGYKFFLIQICLVIIQSMNNIVISNFFGAAEVTSYNITFKYFNTLLVFFQVINTPLWSAYTEASVKNDFTWIKKIIAKMLKLWVVIFAVVLLMIALRKPVFNLWLQGRVQPAMELTIAVGGLVLINCWMGIFNFLLNGLSKIRLQLFVTILGAVLYYPMCLFYTKVLHLGAAGVVLGSVTSLALIGIQAPLQAHKILTNKARGIWLK